MVETHPIKEYREAQNPPLSQGDFGGLYGVTRATVSRWETGERKLSGDKLKQISRGTGIPIAKLRPDLAELMSEAAE